MLLGGERPLWRIGARKADSVAFPSRDAAATTICF